MESFPEWKICNQYQGHGNQSNLEKWFELESGHIRDIRLPADPTELAQQEELTRLLFSLQPYYKEHERDNGAYLEFISKELGLPISVTSFGPTAREKQMHGTLRPTLSKAGSTRFERSNHRIEILV